MTRETKQNTAVFTAVLFLLLCILFSDSVKNAASLSVSNCLNIVIPSLFPITVISFLITEAGFPVKLKHLTDKITRYLFGLSGVCLEGIVLGLTGGYNTAVKCAVALKDKYPEAENQAKRIALFFTNPGISFSVLLTGAALAGSLKAGMRLYAESLFFNLLTAFLYNKFKRNTATVKIHSEHKTLSEAFTSAVKSASAAIISISFNIIFFSCIVCILGNILRFPFVGKLLLLISEVSSAVIYSSENCPFFITAGIAAFGGICIFIQNLEDIRKLNIKPIHFLTVRILLGVLTGTAEFIYSLMFPDAVYSSALFTVKFSASGNSGATASLLFLCLIYLFSVRRIKVHSFTTKKVN